MKDLTGRIFGRLTALHPTRPESSGSQYWLCSCSCGETKEVGSRSLLYAKTKSCGCLQKEKAKEKFSDTLLQQRFGRWVVVSRQGTNKYRQSTWLCRCDCGNERIVPGLALRTGSSRSCGCLNTETRVKRFYTHGLSRTVEYKRTMCSARKDLDSAWTPLMEICLRKLQSTCVLCGANTGLSTDHVRPYTLGYGLEPGNAVTLCMKCNRSKGPRALSDLPVATAETLLEKADEFRVAWSGGF